MSTVLMDLKEIVEVPHRSIFERRAGVVVANLIKRNINALFVRTSAEAVAEVRRLIPNGSSVTLGGSVTVMQTGLLDALREMPLTLLDRYRPGITAAEVEEVLLKGMTADVQIMSCNAITADGKLVNEDGRGNRVAGLIFGPKKVIIVAGVNKIVSNVDEGIARIRSVAAPLNCIRLGLDTPCAHTGFCDDEECLAPERVCSQISIIESNRVKDRITVILVGEELGY